MGVQIQSLSEGGTCIEHCDNVTIKFSCSCTDGFTGKICAVEKAASSCAEYYAWDNSVQNGIYEINDTSNNQIFKVCCDFT